MLKTIKIFSGRSNLSFAQKISLELSVPLCKAHLQTFSDGEISAQYDESIRGSDLFIIQSTNPPSDNLLELLILIDAAKRASASRITAVIPYYGYSRQDRKDKPRVAITAKLVADLISAAGAHRILTMDLHSHQIQGFFNIQVDHLYASNLLAKRFLEYGIENVAVASPDVGGVKLARAYARRLNAPLVIIDKRRPEPNKSEVMNVIGDVEGKNILITDDIIDTAGTIVNASIALKEKGAKQIFAACSHALVSGTAIDKLMESPIEVLITTDSVPRDNQNMQMLDVVSASPFFAEAIRRIYDDDSVSSLFDD
ncbi:hypothetical protein CHS0354_023941 [Potamilus streckersoni]|uniref:ribose-phosphate diphosphokinase n=1 Tax=Potamilus streckersoni TaxID=2493646 RepID=A0AAE0RZ43_9BIVA|nr:hypothetical protein CHS0354_023941 [Potamilus streckersoni]